MIFTDKFSGTAVAVNPINLSIGDNISLPNLDILCNGLGIVNRKKVEEMTEKAAWSLKIKLSNAEVAAGTCPGKPAEG